MGKAVMQDPDRVLTLEEKVRVLAASADAIQIPSDVARELVGANRALRLQLEIADGIRGDAEKVLDRAEVNLRRAGWCVVASFLFLAASMAVWVLIGREVFL